MGPRPRWDCSARKATDGSLQGQCRPCKAAAPNRKLRPRSTFQRTPRDPCGAPPAVARIARSAVAPGRGALTGQCAWGPTTVHDPVRATQRQPPFSFSPPWNIPELPKNISPAHLYKPVAAGRSPQIRSEPRAPLAPLLPRARAPRSFPRSPRSFVQFVRELLGRRRRPG